MTCKYSDQKGKCTLWEGEDSFEHIFISCDINGICIVEDDNDPTLSCEDYESI